MTREDWRRIKDIAGGALEEPAASRDAYVEARCGRDEALRREVESLIDSATRAEELFETPGVLAAGAAVAIESLDRFAGPQPGERVGAYQIVRELPGGGMGAAYLAVRADAEYEKRVAIKLIRRGLDSEAVLRRFRHERQIVADLEHPNIARLLDGGTTANGLPYFVMEYVDGAPIDVHCDARGLSIRERIVLFRKVCDAVEHAHRHQVVHRDLKPANILVTPDGEPKLLDFGIAKLLTPGAGSGRTERTLLSHAMTPPYASPEQIRGEPVTPASDVYALGVLLYELLAGQRPYRLDGRTLREIDDVICRQEPPPPSTVARAGAGLAGDLDTIVLMALRKEPQRRYQSAAALSEDLLRHLEGRPLQARGDERGYRAMRWLRRHRIRLVEAAVVIAAVTAGVVLAPWSNSQTPAPAGVSSLAVLPLSIAASDRDMAYLSEGLAEGLIDSLSRYPGVRVASRDAAFATGREGRDPQAIAEDLDAGGLLLGSLSQTGDAVSVELRYVDGASGRQGWTAVHTGRVTSLIDLRERVTRDVIGRLGLGGEEGMGPASSRQTQDSAAYELYLKGRYVWNKRTEEGFKRGLEYFQQAIDRDPGYALAYTGLADCYNLLGIWGALPPVEAMPLVKEAALSALAIDGTLAEAHTSLAFVHWVYDWDWDAAAAEFQRAIALNPGYATAHDWYGYYLASTGAFEEAIASIRRAKELEPVSLSISTDLGEIYYWAGQYDRAIAELLAVLDVEPDFAMARNILGLTYLKTGRVEDAIVQLEAANRLASGPRMLSTLAHAYGRAGRTEDSAAVAEALREQSAVRYTSAFSLALVQLGTGDHAQAIASLERAFAERSDSMVILQVYPPLEPLRSHPRFQALVRRVGIPSRRL